MTIYGECIGATARVAVRVSQLARNGCALLTESASSLFEGEFLLWIGAIGPLPITATRHSDTLLLANFKEPLDPQIIEHFNCA